MIHPMDAQRSPTPSHTRPLVTVSYAQTLDGRLATRSGSSQWISGPESLRLVHELRASHDAILVGVGTVLRDNPRLTVRLVEGRDPLRVVADTLLRTPLSAAVLASGAARGTLLAASAAAEPARVAALEQAGASVLLLPPDAAAKVPLGVLLRELGVRGIRSVMVEGGARIITALLRERLVDRLVVTVAPTILGAGIEAIGDLGIDDLAAALTLRDVHTQRYGPDLVLDARLSYPEETPDEETEGGGP